MQQKILLSCTPMTLNQGQGQLNGYQNVEFNSIYHHTKLKPNQYKNVHMHASILSFLMQSVNQQLFPSFH